MGNLESQQYPAVQSLLKSNPHLQIIKHSIQTNQCILKNNHPSNSSLNPYYIATSTIAKTRYHQDQIDSLINIKTSFPSPYISNFQNIHKLKIQSFFQSQVHYLFLFQKPHNTLASQIQYRITNQIPFTQQQVQLIIQNVLQALQYLRIHNHPHSNVNSANIIINQQRQIKLTDPWMIIKSQKIQQNFSLQYPSPQKLQNINEEFVNYSIHQSDLFSLGIVALQALNKKSMKDIYISKSYVDPMIIKNYISNIKSQKLRKYIEILTYFDPKRRKQIYSYVNSQKQKPLSSKNFHQLQTFRKSIIGKIQQIPSQQKSARYYSHISQQSSNYTNNNNIKPIQKNLFYKQEVKSEIYQPKTFTQKNHFNNSKFMNFQNNRIQSQPSLLPLNIINSHQKHNFSSAKVFQQQRNAYFSHTPNHQMKINFSKPLQNKQIQRVIVSNGLTPKLSLQNNFMKYQPITNSIQQKRSDFKLTWNKKEANLSNFNSTIGSKIAEQKVNNSIQRERQRQNHKYDFLKYSNLNNSLNEMNSIKSMSKFNKIYNVENINNINQQNRLIKQNQYLGLDQKIQPEQKKIQKQNRDINKKEQITYTEISQLKNKIPLIKDSLSGENKQIKNKIQQIVKNGENNKKFQNIQFKTKFQQTLDEINKIQTKLFQNIHKKQRQNQNKITYQQKYQSIYQQQEPSKIVKTSLNQKISKTFNQQQYPISQQQHQQQQKSQNLEIKPQEQKQNLQIQINKKLQPKTIQQISTKPINNLLDHSIKTNLQQQPISSSPISGIRDRKQKFNIIDPLPNFNQNINNQHHKNQQQHFPIIQRQIQNIHIPEIQKQQVKPIQTNLKQQIYDKYKYSKNQNYYQNDINEQGSLQKIVQQDYDYSAIESNQSQDLDGFDQNILFNQVDQNQNSRKPFCPPSSNNSWSPQKKYQELRQQSQEQQYVIEEYQVGSRYQGQKKYGMRNGWGKFYYQQGSLYDGQWKDNKMHGYGKLYYANGQLAYEGDWYQDQFHGQGKVYNDNPVILDGPFDYTDFNNLEQQWVFYEGGLVSDVKQGLGKIKLQNDQIFMGHFENDKLNGEGRFYCGDGSVIHGIWKDSLLVQRIQ